MHSNPYSSKRPASPEIFRGYGEAPRAPGDWTIEEMIDCWLRAEGGAPSFWVVGERKLGKTSLLVRLENLLMTAPGRSLESPRIVVPLLVSCRRLRSLDAFYRTVLERALAVLGEGCALAYGAAELGLDRTRFWLLQPPGEAVLPALDLLDRAAEDLVELIALLAAGTGLEVRLVLLIDDVEAAAEEGWAGLLCQHLATLLAGYPPFVSLGTAWRREALAIVLASGRSLAGTEGVCGLLDLLEELPVRPLAVPEVRALINEPRQVQLDSRWLYLVYQVTAGHPWLVQFVMEDLGQAGQLDAPEQKDLLQWIARFRRDPAGPPIFRHYLESLLDHGVEILAHLALDRRRGTVKALAERTELSPAAVTVRLRQMMSLGILCQLPGEANEPEPIYVLGEMFKHWFLEHTGGTVYCDEIAHLRQATSAETSQLQILNAPFTLTLGLNPDFLLADGLYTRLIGLDRDLSESIELSAPVIRNPAQKSILDWLASTLRKSLRQSDWEPVWNDYDQKVRSQGREPRFVLRVGAKELFEFPIELVKVDGKPLGLVAPVYKEWIAEHREPAYRLVRNSFPLDAPLNVLLVGSGRAGELGGLRYRDLPLVRQEVVDLLQVLGQGNPGQGMALGEIAALVDTDEALPEGVKRFAPSAANLARALRGELGIRFHLFHYCGHYIPNDRDEEGGFLLHDGVRPELFNLASWRNSLAQTSLRFVCLSACGSAQHVPEPRLYHLGAAHTALTSGVPVVIGMRWSITDAQGHDFSRTFYRRLLESGIPELALHRTRCELLENEPGSTLWAAPVMLTR